jgi:predicted ATP-binding protein involved in virulence
VKLRKVKYNNHSVLGNITLDFCDQLTQKPYNNIVFAGENGTGKTTILETISSFLNLRSFKPFEYIEYEIDTDIFKAVQHEMPPPVDAFFDIIDGDGNKHYIQTDKSNNYQDIQINTRDLRKYGCMLSKARSDYKTSTI